MAFPVHWWELSIENSDNPYVLQVVKALGPESGISCSLAFSEKEGSKKCSKGKSCKATCIYKGDDCLEGLGPNLSQSVSQVIDQLRSLEGKGAISGDQAESYLSRFLGESEEEGDENSTSVSLNKARVKEFNEASERLRESCTKDGVLDQKLYEEKLERTVTLAVWASFTDRDKKYPVSPDELEAIHGRRGMLEDYDKLSREVAKRKEEGNPMSPKELQEKLRPLAEKRRTQTISEEEVDLFISMLPEQERNYLKKAGALDKKDTGGKFGDDAKSDALPEEYGPLGKQGSKYEKARMRLLARVYLEEDGRDFASGFRIPLTHGDLEHTIAEETAGRAAEQGLNYSFMRTPLNVGRGKNFHLDWWDSKVKKEKLEFDENGKLTPKSRKKAQEVYEQTIEQIRLKSDIEVRAKRAKNAEMLKELYEQASSVGDLALKRKLFTKIIAFNLGVAETVSGGVQASGRGGKRWYWLGEDTFEGDKVSSQIIEKLITLYQRGDQSGLDKAREILSGSSAQVRRRVEAEIEPAPGDIDPDTGKPFVRVKGERGERVRAIVTETRDKALEELLSIP